MIDEKWTLKISTIDNIVEPKIQTGIHEALYRENRSLPRHTTIAEIKYDVKTKARNFKYAIISISTLL